MKPKLPSILLITLLFLYASLSHGARPFPSESSVNRYQQRNGEMDLDPLDEEVEVCDRLKPEEDDDECMMRRTLVAHTDYIYTQGNQH